MASTERHLSSPAPCAAGAVQSRIWDCALVLVSDFRPTCICSRSRLYQTLAPRGDRHAATVHDHVSRVRARLNRDNADGCVSLLLHLHALRPPHAAKARQLLRPLLLWRPALSSQSGGIVVLLTQRRRVGLRARPTSCVAGLVGADLDDGP